MRSKAMQRTFWSAAALLFFVSSFSFGQGVYLGLKGAPVPLIMGKVAKIIQESPFLKLAETNLDVRLINFYYEGTVMPNGFVKPTAGEAQDLYIGGSKVSLLSNDFSSGYMTTGEYGRIMILFTQNRICIIAMTPDQLDKLESSILGHWGTKAAPIPYTWGRVARIVQEGQSIKIVEMILEVKLIKFYYEGTVMPDGFIKPTAGEAQDLYIGGSKISLLSNDLNDFSSGYIATKEYGQFMILFNKNRACIIALTPEQLNTLEHSITSEEPTVEKLPETHTSPFMRKIAFKSKRDGNEEIYVINADGSGLKRLTENPEPDENPTWSPDGKRILFVSTRNRERQICLMNADGSRQCNLTYNLVDTGNPVWSNDGLRFAFSSEHGDNDEIHVMNIDGSEDKRLTFNKANDWPSAWSRDGSKILFESTRDGNQEIYVMNADGSDQTNLTNNSADDWSPVWSPDGEKVLFLSSRRGDTEIYIMNSDGSMQTRLTSSLGLAGFTKWSPDGNRISYIGERKKMDLYTMNRDGSGQTQLLKKTKCSTS